MFKSYRLLLVLIVLSLLILLVPACGGGKSSSLQTPTTTGAIGTSTPTSTPTETPAVTPTPTVTPAATPTPTTSEPVKLGVINAWSGPLAVSGNLADQCIAVIEQQVKDMGGILGGRQVQFVRADDNGVLAQSVAQVSKLALEKNVDMILFGGESGASMNAVGQEAAKLKVPFIAPSMNYGKPLLPYNVSMTSADAWIGRTVNFPIEFVKPKTIAWLAYDDKNIRDQLDGVLGVVGARERWKAAGLDLIYEQYFPQDAMDFSPYLTKIKYLNPDLVIIATNNLGQAITINKQIIELGGWGNMKVWYSTEAASGQKAISMPAALGTYVSVLWMPGSNDPGMKTFEDAFMKTWKREPSADLAYYHVCFWAAIKAIEMAGTTERDKVAQAMRSGNFEFDSAWGHMRIAPDGYANFNMPVAQVQEGGKLVKVWPLN